MAGIDGKARFLTTLVEAQDKNRAVAIYAESDDYQSYEVGFVEHADSTEIVLKCLTPKGEPDGRRAIRTDDVIRIDTDNAYVRRLELLYEYRETVFEKDFRALPSRAATDLGAQLRHAKEANTIVHLVDANDYGPSGFVHEIGEDYVEVERIGTNGEPDGMSTMLMSTINKIHVGRRQDQVLEFLYRYNYELKRLLES